MLIKILRMAYFLSSAEAVLINLMKKYEIYDTYLEIFEILDLLIYNDIFNIRFKGP